MKLEPIEILEDSTGHSEPHIQTQQLHNKQANLLNINPTTLSQISQIILPLLNAFTNSNSLKSNDDKKIETQNYEVKDIGKSDDLPQSNPQFELKNILSKGDIMQQNKCISCNNSDNSIEMKSISKLKSKHKVETQMEKHRNLVEYIKSNLNKNS